MSETIEYYNKNAEKFIQDTVSANMSSIQEDFLSHIPEQGFILDLGCGSGRDTKLFSDKGYKVLAVDGSEKMCQAAQRLSGQRVICSTFQDFETDLLFDGIWACASLLHLNKHEIKSVIKKMVDYLKEGGIFYMSFKYGDYQGIRNGRYFTYLNEESLQPLVCDELSLVSYTITGDVRPNRADEKWLNALYIRNHI